MCQMPSSVLLLFSAVFHSIAIRPTLLIILVEREIIIEWRSIAALQMQQNRKTQSRKTHRCRNAYAVQAATPTALTITGCGSSTA